MEVLQEFAGGKIKTFPRVTRSTQYSTSQIGLEISNRFEETKQMLRFVKLYLR